MPTFGIAESQEMDPASRRTFGKLKKYIDNKLGLGLTYPTAVEPVILGRRNLFHNGQMAVSQRYGASGTVVLPLSAAASYAADRWGIVDNRTTGTIQISYTSYAGYGIGFPQGRPQPGQMQRLQVTAAGAAIGPNDYVLWYQAIEGCNLQHLDWATAKAKPLTLSFECFSSAGGTYVFELYNNITGRAISKRFTVPAAQTTTVVLTFPGDTGGTVFANTAATALTVQCFIAAGTTFTGGGAYTGNDWNTPTNSRAFGVSTAFGTVLNDTFVLQNLQLEVGSVATPFEVRPYPDELRDCMRYYQQHLHFHMTAVCTQAANPNLARLGGLLPVVMRAYPSVSFIGSPAIYDGVNGGTATGITGNYSHPTHIELDATSNLAAAGVAPGRMIVTYDGGTWYVVANAEL